MTPGLLLQATEACRDAKHAVRYQPCLDCLINHVVLAAVLEERERCAELVESMRFRHYGDEALEAAAAIRARP